MAWKLNSVLSVGIRIISMVVLTATLADSQIEEQVRLASNESASGSFFSHQISERNITDSMPLFWPSPIQPVYVPKKETTERFHWKAAINESLLFLAVEHLHRFGEEQDTRHDLRGPFSSDWFESVGNLRGWADGDEFYVNYIGHPMQGAVTGFIQIQNDPQGRGQVFHMGKEYWKSRSKAMLWATLYSVQFEIGPISESSLGNVGLKPTSKSAHPQAYVDLVITPTLGTAWLIGEDAMDRYVVSRFERNTDNRLARLLLRSFANPCRSFSNMMRMKVPWYRDSRNAGVTW